MKRTLTALLLLCLAIPAAAQTAGRREAGTGQSIDRSKPPVTPPLAAYHLPPVFETTLPNGLAIMLVEDHRLPLVSVRLAFRAGSKFDPGSLGGLAETTGALLKEGTKTRSSRQIAEELAAIGGGLSAGTDADSLIVAADALAEHTTDLLDLLADVARDATFPEDEVQLRKQNRKQELLAERAEAATLAEEKEMQVVFGSHPYSRMLPEPETIERIDRAVLAGFRDRLLVPNNAVLLLIGALPPRAQLMKTLEDKFGSWRRKEAPAAPSAPIPKPVRSIVLVDRPGSVQADIRIGKLAVARTSPEYLPLRVADTVLGGGTSSRMFMNIREKMGFAYDAHSELESRKDSGVISAVTEVRNEVVEPAMQALFAELRRMAAEPVPAAELTDIRNFLSGTFVIRLETQGGLAQQLVNVKMMGLPNDFLEKYVPRIQAVDPAQIQQVSAKYLAPDDASVVVVGDASKIRTQLEKFGKVTVEKAK